MKKKILFLSILFNSIIFSNQLVFEYPINKDKFDDSILTNQIYEFKSFKNQGYLDIDYKDLKNINIYINGNKINTKNIKGTGEKKINISNYTKNNKNIFQVDNIKGNVKITLPYPELKKENYINYNKETIKFLEEFINAEVKAGLPSAQITVLKDGKVEYQNSFGYVNNYNQNGEKLKNRIKVTNNTMYDLASNTKMYATNYAIMKLVSDKKLKLDDYLSKYFNGFDKNRKEKIQVRDLLEHQAGFPPSIEFYKDGIKKDKIIDAISKVELIYEPKTDTKYSDLDYMLLGLLVEKISNMPLDKYVYENFYKPLNLKRTMFNPLKHSISKNEIAATELNGNTRDHSIYFDGIRTYTLQGEVHDEKAYYTMQGVSGHAGLFSNSYELAKLAQVIINDGGYGENKFFDKTTLDEFIKPKTINSSYGLGFRREGDFKYIWAFSGYASRNTVGHTGWTGTLTIIDKEQNIVIVLLTNSKNSPVIDPKKNPNRFYGNEYYTTNYGVISSLLFDAFVNKNSKNTYERMNDILEDLIKGKYNLILTNENYTNKANIDDTIELIKLLNKRNSKTISKYSENLKTLKELKNEN